MTFLDLAERKKMYVSGRVPLEDEEFKILLRQSTGMIQKVEKKSEYSGDKSKKSSMSMAEVIQEREFARSKVSDFVMNANSEHQIEA